MFKNLIQKFKAKRRKHKFDLENPMVVTYGGIEIGGIPFRQTVYECKLCGKTYLLDYNDMQRLPRTMAYGCPGEKKTDG